MSDISSDETLKGTRRNLKIGSTAGGVLFNQLRNAAGIGGDREKEAAALKEALGSLRGPLVKFAQLLASFPDLLPPEYSRELAELQSNAPPMGRPFVKRRMSHELGHGWRRQFAEFELEPRAAASLGQVHRGVLHDGREVACKLQYPGMQDTVEADLKQAGWLLNMFERYEGSVRTGRIVEELKERIFEELDYTLEFRRIAMYREMLADEPGVQVPEPVAELSSGRLLTAEWLHGRPIMEARAYPQAVRDEIATAMFRLWYKPLYDYAVIHGDPHFGNYTIREDRGINLLDYGCIRVFPARFVEGVIRLYEALRDDDRDKAAYAYRCWNFENLSNELIDSLNEWARFVYGPVLSDTELSVNTTNDVQTGRKKVEELRKLLKRAGGVELPREFVFMDRASVGLGALFMRLDAQVNWHRLFNEMIEGFDHDAVAARQADLLARHGHPAASAADL
jgi:predicted unusual protein kinase regulating ubiquinone biosynthesis (AarF/ABC1/UbiB family)